MKKSELKALLKVITEEVMTVKSNLNEDESAALFQQLETALKQHDWYYQHSDDPRIFSKGRGELREIFSLMDQLKKLGKETEAFAMFKKYNPQSKSSVQESTGLSGFEKSKDSTEHTENIADSKDLTGNTEPKENKAGTKLPKVNQPKNPQKVGSIKEDILKIIREEIEEYRTKGALGKNNPNRTTPVNTYVKKGTNPNLGRPKKSVTIGAGPNTKVGLRFDGEDLGEIDMRLVKGSFLGYLKRYLSGRNIELGLFNIDPSVQTKLDAFSDAYMDDNLPEGSILDLKVDNDTVKAI